MELILVRHGQTRSNVSRIIDTQFPGEPITDSGKEQADNLVETFSQVPLDAIACSPILRAKQTLSPLAEAKIINPLILEGLREVQAGPELEISGNIEDLEYYFSTVISWFTEGSERRLHPSEDRKIIAERFDQAVSELCAKGNRPILVSHGTVLGIWALDKVSGMTLEIAIGHHLGNTEHFVVEGEPGNWRIRYWGELKYKPI